MGVEVTPGTIETDGTQPLVSRALIALAALVSLGWLVPASIVWWLTAKAARQTAVGERHLNSFPYERVATDATAVAWWWALTAALAWGIGAAAYLRWRRRVR